MSFNIVSTSDAWSNNSSWCAYEFFPSEEPWDTVWTVGRNEIISTPYLQNYKGRLPLIFYENLVELFSNEESVIIF